MSIKMDGRKILAVIAAGALVMAPGLMIAGCGSGGCGG